MEYRPSIGVSPINWSIAHQLRGAMDADDLRDDMFSFLFLRHFFDNYETMAKAALKWELA